MLMSLILAAAVADPVPAAVPSTPTSAVGLAPKGGPCLVPGCDYDVPPKIVHKTKPVPPAEAIRKLIQGEVRLQFTVTETGEPTDVRVIESVPGLDEAAVECVRQWRFEPARKSGDPVRSEVQAGVTFKAFRSGFAGAAMSGSGLARSFVVPPKRPKDEVPDLVQMLQHKKAAKRAEAAWKLSALPDAGPDAVAALTPRLDDPSAEVRDRAAVALFGMGDPGGTLAAQPPRPVTSSRRPIYRSEPLQKQIAGTVELLLLVSDSGHVIQARFVKQATPELDATALAMASHWRYEPKLVEPRPFVARAIFTFKNGDIEIGPAPAP